MANPTWNDGTDTWDTAADWSTGQEPGSGDDVTINTGDPTITTNVGTVASVADNSNLSLIGGTLTTTAAFVNTSTVQIDATGYGEGGASLAIGGALTNSGMVYIGNSGLSASDEISAASLDNTGTIQLQGDSANQAVLDIAGPAGFGTAGEVTGNVYIGYGFTSNSLLEFGSGEITSIDSGAVLDINTSTSYVADAGATDSNSALTGLASNDGTFNLEDGASVSTTQARDRKLNLSKCELMLI